MHIDDPTRIPDSEADALARLHEADRLWDDYRHDEAHVIYIAVVQSSWLPATHQGRAALRAAQYLFDRGDLDGAYRFVRVNAEHGAADLRRRIAEAHPNGAVDPGEVPHDIEDVDRYIAVAEGALSNHDDATALAVADAGLRYDHLTGGVEARLRYVRGEALRRTGRADEARDEYERALPIAVGPTHELVATALRAVGTQSVDDVAQRATQDELAGRLTDAIEAYERGAVDQARTGLLAVLDDQAANRTERGRALYYLGSLERWAGHYEQARGYYRQCAEHGSEPEQGWAQRVLHERWQEEPATAAAL